MSAYAEILTDITTFVVDGTDHPGDYIDHGWGDVNRLDWAGDYVIWAHQFDFSPPLQEILNATLTLSFYDDERDKWWNAMTWDIGIGATEEGTWAIGCIDTGDYQFDVDATYLLDGTFTVATASLWGDFFIESSTLVIEYIPIDITYTSDVNPVPEPGSLLLLGSGIACLVRLRRKFKRA